MPLVHKTGKIENVGRASVALTNAVVGKGVTMWDIFGSAWAHQGSGYLVRCIRRRAALKAALTPIVLCGFRRKHPMVHSRGPVQPPRSCRPRLPPRHTGH